MSHLPGLNRGPTVYDTVALPAELRWLVIKLYLPIYFLFKSEWGQLGPDASVGVPTRFVQIVSGLRWQSKKYTTKTMFFNNKKKWPNGHFFLEPLIGIEPMTSSFI